MNEFLQSSQIIIADSVFDASKKFLKDWIPDGIPITIVGRNARFFKWNAPGKQTTFDVPLNLLYEVNLPPLDYGLPANANEYPSYPRPDGPLPEGKELIWDPLCAGLMKIVDIGSDQRTDTQRIEDSLKRVEEKLDLLLAR